MNVFIIGGTNFIGPAIAGELLKEGHNVTLFHRLAGNGLDECTHIQGDCINADDLQSAIQNADPDVIIHMAAYFRSHILALEKALDNRIMKTVIISSADVYKGYEVIAGLSDIGPVPVPFGERSPLRDVLFPYRGRLDIDIANDYEKILVEGAALESPVLDAVILRLGMVYGERDPNRRFADPIHKMASGAKTIGIAEDMAGFRACKSYVKNIAHGVVLAAMKGRSGEIYNLADKYVFTELEWLELLAKKLNWTGEIIPSDEKTADLNTRQHFLLDTGKIRTSLGYKEIVSPDEALSNTIKWELSRGQENSF
ncbi:NAD-dependent epimerase/dehydratase family protein [Lachnospiraceae bacterium 54-53]